MKRIVHYVNQFFAGLGGEESAGLAPGHLEGAVGPGRLLQSLLGEGAGIVSTVYCGDDHFSENEEEATARLLELIAASKPDLLFAGPAFGSGRYGLACAGVCRAAGAELGIPVLTAMALSNPGAEAIRREIPVVRTGESSGDMRAALEHSAGLIARILTGETVAPGSEEGLIRGGRWNTRVSRRSAERAVDLLLAKLAGGPMETEIPLPALEEVEPAPGIRDLGHAKVALVTTGGLVPRGNPDGIKSYLSTHFGAYGLESKEHLTADEFESVHGGFFTAAVNEDPNRLIPLDVLRDAVRDGSLGGLHEYFYSTTGNGTPIETAASMARDIAASLEEDGVDGVILTSA
jgi:glycine reductase